MILRYKSAFLSVAAVIAATCSPGVLWAQNCGDLPSRGEVSQQRIAIKLSGMWEFFASNPTGPAHVISVAGTQNLCLAWEAPPYPHNQKQIVYASTQYREDQPIWLWRNNAFQIPIFNVLMGNWSRTPDYSGRDPVETYITFHRSLPGDVDVAPWRDLASLARHLGLVSQPKQLRLGVYCFGRRRGQPTLRYGKTVGIESWPSAQFLGSVHNLCTNG